MRPSVVTVCLALVALAGTSLAQAPDPVAELRQTALSMPPKLLEVLTQEIAKGGYGNAINVCSEQAPAMAKKLSDAKGMQIRRVSLRNRNPKAVPDAWERGVLLDFDKRVTAGEKVDLMEASTTVTEGGKRVVRYMKALPTQDLCLACHGADTQLDKGAKARLKELYPQDRATGYAPGQVRGAITVSKVL